MVRANVRFGQRVVAKISCLLSVLRVALKDKHLKNVPDFVANPAKESLDKLEDMNKESQSAIKSRGVGVSFTFDKDDLQSAFSSATERNALLAKMLETARKHSA